MDPPIKKVLVIDDDVSLHDLCRAILTRYGYLCVSAHSGEEGLEKLQPDIYLTMDIDAISRNEYILIEKKFNRGSSSFDQGLYQH